MTIEIWAAYTLAAIVVLVIPGPTILLVISQAVAHGRRAAAPLAAGVFFGDFTAMALSLLGLGTLLAVSATLFSVLKLIGAGYLIFLGLRLWRSAPEDRHAGAVDSPGGSSRSLFTSAYVVTATNPKGIAFFVAFLPQFVQPGSPVLPQLFLLGGTFLVLAGLNAALYALFAGELRETLQSPSVCRWFNRGGAVALIGAGLFTAALRRTGA